MPKLDELIAVIETRNPDIVCIVESWLCVDIPDSELYILGYQIFRKDRHRHGGGVLVYIKNIFIVTVLPSHQVDLEILPIVIHLSNISFCITVFYRPPDTSAHIFDTLFNFLVSLYIHQFSHLY